MKLKVFFPQGDESEGYVNYIAKGFQITSDGTLVLYATNTDDEILAAYAPRFWSTIENMDEIDKQYRE